MEKVEPVLPCPRFRIKIMGVPFRQYRDVGLVVNHDFALAQVKIFSPE